MPSTRLSLAEILSASVSLSVQDATAIVGELCRRLSGDSAAPRATPLRPQHVWLDREGSVSLSPGVVPDVHGLGGLLQQLLDEVRRGGPARFPPRLVLTVARATGGMEGASIPSVAALADALAPFEPPDRAAAIARLFDAYVESQAGAADGRTRQAAGGEPLATQERPVLVPVDRDALLEFEYQTPVIVARRVRPERTVRHDAKRNRWVRAGAVGAFAAAGLAAGIAGAVLVYLPYASANRPTESTDVVVSAPPQIVPKPSGSKARVRPESSTRTPARARTAIVPPSRQATTTPQPLLDPGTVDADAAYSPSFAQNGSAVFFHAQSAEGTALKRAERGEDGDLRVVTIVDDAAKNYHVQLSPDGGSVAFDSDRDGVRGVYVARADGTDVRRMSGPGYAAVPTWSPDGRRLAFLRAENDRPSVWNLWVMAVGSGEMSRLTNHPYGQVWGGAWFPDSRRIAYSHEDRLIVLDPASGRTTSYTSPRKGRLVRTPAVSPDGHWIVFQVFRDGAWLLDLASGSMERVLDDASAEEFTWAPDGKRVAFHSRRSGHWGLWTMAAR